MGDSCNKGNLLCSQRVGDYGVILLCLPGQSFHNAKWTVTALVSTTDSTCSLSRLITGARF